MIIDKFSQKITFLCTFVLFLKFTITILIQGGKRFAGGTRPPEDEKLSLAKIYKTKQSYGLVKVDNQKAIEADIRWQRIVLNDLENIPFGLIIAWASLLSSFFPQVHNLCVIVFTLARISHTIAYAYEKQPHRGICWFVSVLSVLCLGLNGLVGVLLL